MIRFGPAGNSDSFTAKGYKNALQIPDYLKEFGLNAFEYQAGRGVKISEDAAKRFGEAAKAGGIELSIHAPYYISLASAEQEKRLNSINYFLQAAKAITAMGFGRVVFHPGGVGKMSRADALAATKDTLKKAIEALDAAGYGSVRLCPETMGKINQIGDLAEVIEICTMDERLIPCIDFGHLNARTLGGLKAFGAVQNVFESIESSLGVSRLREMHAHFSKIEFTAGGEKQHLTFDDAIYGPDFEPVAEMLAKKQVNNAVFICESAGTQAEDAQKMKRIFEAVRV